MKQEKSGNFFQNLLSSLFGGNDGEAEKRRQLRSISKRLSKSKFGKFYKFAGNEALPLLARNIFEIYKIIYPAQTMFQNLQNPNVLKRLAIDLYTPNEIRTLETSLSQENLLAMSKKIPAEKLKQQALTRLSEYSDYFTLEKITKIDTLYKQISCFRDLCMFDFYFFLKKFNKSLREADFSIIPQFEKINAEYILDDLKDFMSVAWAVPLDADYTDMTKLFRIYKGVEPITLQNWKRVISRISAFRQSGSFEMMIKLISSDPSASVSVSEQTQNIIEPYLDSFKQETENTLNKIETQEKDSKTSEICSQLFNGIEITPMKYFTDELNATFTRKGLRTFENTQLLSYIKVFLLEIVKKNLREYYDLVLVRGKWESQALSSPFSESYNSLLATSDLITQFDNQLAEDAPIGMKIKTLLPKTERDNGAKNIINRLVSDANESACSFITDTTTNLVTIGKIIKSLVEDIEKPKPVLVTNWKELAHFSEIPIREMSVKLYKKIYLLITLVKTCLVQPDDNE